MQKSGLFVLCIICSLFCNAQIHVDASGRFLREKSGKRFFWMGDTGWELFHRLTREEALEYLDLRAKQGFNVIQAVVLAESDGLNTPNRYGDRPFINNMPSKWATTLGCDYGDSIQYDYWDNVDYIIQEAAKRNLYIALLPTWGDKVTPRWGAGPAIFNEENAFDYTRRLAERYQNQWNIIWILGGDRPVVYNREIDGKQQHFDVRNIWRKMAEGIQSVYGKDEFITYHPGGSGDGTHKMWPEEDWLKMHAFQSGHGSREAASWQEVRKSLSDEPHKPVMDMEPAYEDHPVNPWDGKWTRAFRGFFSDYDVRARIYRSVLAGAPGVTYGHHAIWQFLDTSRHPPIFFGDTIIPWRQAMQAPAGAKQMNYLRQLMENRSDWNTVEDAQLIASSAGKDYKDIIVANQNEAGTQAMIYLPQPVAIRINLDRMKPGNKTARWFNPATGEYANINKRLNKGVISFQPPAGNRDWVLLINNQ